MSFESRLRDVEWRARLLQRDLADAERRIRAVREGARDLDVESGSIFNSIFNPQGPGGDTVFTIRLLGANSLPFTETTGAIVTINDHATGLPVVTGPTDSTGHFRWVGFASRTYDGTLTCVGNSIPGFIGSPLLNGHTYTVALDDTSILAMYHPFLPMPIPLKFATFSDQYGSNPWGGAGGAIRYSNILTLAGTTSVGSIVAGLRVCAPPAAGNFDLNYQLTGPINFGFGPPVLTLTETFCGANRADITTTGGVSGLGAATCTGGGTAGSYTPTSIHAEFDLTGQTNATVMYPTGSQVFNIDF